MKKIKETPQSLFSSRTSHIIGREDILRRIGKAIANPSAKSHVLYLEGPGGIGKTRLLEEVANIQKQGKKFLWSGIIDLYHEENHSPDNLQKAIVTGVDPSCKYFPKFQQFQRELEEKQRQGFSGPTLENLRKSVNQHFLTEYKALAAKRRLVLCFDTVELIQYESDIVQRICQVEDEDTVVKNWMLSHIVRFPNTVTLLAGRPQSEAAEDEFKKARIEEDFKKAFVKLNYQKYTLQRLTPKESQAYLDAMIERRPELSEVLSPAARKWVLEIAEGRPIRLTLSVDLLIQGDGSLPPKESIDADLVYRLYLSPESAEIFRYLIIARKGLDTDLLRHLTKWPRKKIKDTLNQMTGLEIIKTHRGSDRLFLHDEIYDLVDLYFKDDPRFGPEHYSDILKYYEEKLSKAKPNDREEWIVALLYYAFQKDAKSGYHHYYARLDEEAIRSHETGLDMRLRDEGLRFMDRYAKSGSPFSTSRVATNIDRQAIDRDCAVRWVKRYIARGQFKKADAVAHNIRYSSEPSFDWDTITDPLYKSGLLAAWAEAMIYTGAPENKIQEMLNEAIQCLEEDQHWDEDQGWWRARILGDAYNRLGYLHRARGRYDLALENYRHALPYFLDANIPDERANTLNNMAFLLALLGRVRLARTHVDQALDIRQNLGRKYPVALSLNTRGLIFVLEDHPMWGEQDCRAALQMCEELGDPRGIGLAHLGLALALRKRGDQWKIGRYSQKAAEKFFEESEEHLKKAIEIFSGALFEPIRLWEAYNELGSLYCDRGWLTQQRRSGKRETLGKLALAQYAQSIGYQQQAIKVAEDQELFFQIADSYDDLAQAYADQGFLMKDLGQTAESDESLATAASYLDKPLEMAPQKFHLVPGKGFQQAPEHGEAFWLALGKAHLQRGIWLWRIIERREFPESEREERLQEGIRHFAIATAYFSQYWQNSHAFVEGMNAFASRLQKAEVPAELARSVVQQVADEYQVNLDPLLETIDNVLGI